MQTLAILLCLFVEEPVFAHWAMHLEVLLYVETGDRVQYSDCLLRIGRRIAYRDDIRLAERLDRQTFSQTGDRPPDPRLFAIVPPMKEPPLFVALVLQTQFDDGLAEQIFAVEHLYFRIQLGFADLRMGEVGRSDRLRGHKRVCTFAAHQNF